MHTYFPFALQPLIYLNMIIALILISVYDIDYLVLECVILRVSSSSDSFMLENHKKS